MSHAKATSMVFCCGVMRIVGNWTWNQMGHCILEKKCSGVTGYVWCTMHFYVRYWKSKTYKTAPLTTGKIPSLKLFELDFSLIRNVNNFPAILNYKRTLLAKQSHQYRDFVKAIYYRSYKPVWQPV